MKTTSVTRLKNELSAQLKEVVAGETVLITDRRKPIATLQPLTAGGVVADVSRLSSKGVVSLPPKPLSVAGLLKLPKAVAQSTLTDAVLEERDFR